ncbi:hypothetical protein HELRODRAFT_182829 [Helobdella robusta]|uniref:Major facilitator superfamily (MFS) profile domain-containing protein n=1 Tax=Helobdella robusta TaxID=6412 RepID=T1FIT6_HELRO|nr:hypothetical protein HELRODRAFT_182829 [Helobdella robusta]ESN90132.1 hypothetical protein HELRODRAFT_182829 [Helobdella robusta]
MVPVSRSLADDLTILEIAFGVICWNVICSSFVFVFCIITMKCCSITITAIIFYNFNTNSYSIKSIKKSIVLYKTLCMKNFQLVLTLLKYRYQFAGEFDIHARSKRTERHLHRNVGSIREVDVVGGLHVRYLAGGQCANFVHPHIPRPGVFVGMAIKKFGCRVVCICGTLLTSLGFFLTFFATSVVHLFFSYGFLAGFGIDTIVSSCYVNAMVNFEDRRTLAGAVTSVGYSLGAVFIGPVTRYLFELHTWRGVLLLFAGFTLHMLPAVAFAFKPKSSITSRKSTVVPTLSSVVKKNDTKADQDGVVVSMQRSFSGPSAEIQLPALTFRQIFRDPAFVCYLLSCFFLFVGTIVCINHYPSRAQMIGIDRKLISYLPVATDGMAIFSKVIMAISTFYFKYNTKFVFTLALLASGLLYVAIYFCRTFPSLMLHSGARSSMNFENRWVLRSALNFASDGKVVREVGREFQRKGPEKAKADLAKECLTRVKKKREEKDERKLGRLGEHGNWDGGNPEGLSKTLFMAMGILWNEESLFGNCD